MLMVAIREHGYLGRRIKSGTKYEVRSMTDATVLRAAKLARNATEAERAEWQKLKFGNISTGNVAAPANVVTDDVVEEPIVYSSRDEEPEGEVEQTSPKDARRSQRRRYRRKDMVPKN